MSEPNAQSAVLRDRLLQVVAYLDDVVSPSEAPVRTLAGVGRFVASLSRTACLGVSCTRARAGCGWRRSASPRPSRFQRSSTP